MTTESTQIRRCIGSTRFGIEAHDADARRLPRPAQPEGWSRADVQAPLARVHERPAQGRGGAEGGGRDGRGGAGPSRRSVEAPGRGPRAGGASTAQDPARQGRAEGRGRRRVATSSPHDRPRARVRGLLCPVVRTPPAGQRRPRWPCGAHRDNTCEGGTRQRAGVGTSIWTLPSASLIMPRQYRSHRRGVMAAGGRPLRGREGGLPTHPSRRSVSLFVVVLTRRRARRRLGHGVIPSNGNLLRLPDEVDRRGEGHQLPQEGV